MNKNTPASSQSLGWMVDIGFLLVSRYAGLLQQVLRQDKNSVDHLFSVLEKLLSLLKEDLILWRFLTEALPKIRQSKWLSVYAKLLAYPHR